MGAPTPRPPGGEATRRVLSIAGSDSGGGAGIQADLKAFARCGVHGMTAVTAITAQNTVGVSVVAPVAPEVVLEQIRCVLEDIGVDAVKVGMLGTVEVTLAVGRALDQLPAATPVVVDPVMVSESGASLLDPEAQRALLAEILPRATVLTPNVSEARVLAGEAAGPADDDAAAQALARAVLALGPRIVVLTGGHRSSASDLFLDSADPGSIVSIEGRRHPDGAAHGSGCTHSSVLAAQLALGRTPLAAARVARELAGAAVARGLREIGAGAGPVDVIDLARMRRTATGPGDGLP
jgi:hydroxymethylpyrimidine/phosphomethylpyrimidine kinase